MCIPLFYFRFHVFEDLAKHYLAKLLCCFGTGEVVVEVFDQYLPCSIKAMERSRRQSLNSSGVYQSQYPYCIFDHINMLMHGLKTKYFHKMTVF